MSGRRHQSPDLDAALAFRVHHTNRLLRTHLARFLQRHAPGVSPEQWFVVARLAARGPLRQVDLAEPVLGDPPNVSRLVDVLVAAGYAERAADPADRRSTRVALTPAGESLARTVQREVIAERHAVFAGFSDAEMDSLAALLDRLDDNLRGLLAPPGNTP